ncbi:NADPH:quinone oxidoreductase-like [Phoenix dactylifera]|uniref:NAD(P)H dehydrogenase (quinone) n=1 Tax=Phoenix dactylifera TaxID=42345 RepID=A0A8B7CUA2_PHODC|nr:NADPH:quinone oxidoreductase-like [Phoenix dactylifera]
MEAAAAAAAAKPAIRVAAICGSLRKASFNRGLIRCAIELCSESIPGMRIEHVDIEPLPFCNPDLEIDGKFPPPVEAFRRKILEADSILFASPEYNYSLSAPLKNAIDWGSRPPNVWGDKTAAIVSAAGGSGGIHSQYHLRQVGVFIDLHFINKPELFIQGYRPPVKFDGDGNLIDPETKERLKRVLLSLQAFTHRLSRSS